MPAKQGNSGNKLNIKALSFYALMVALCLIIGYIESLVNLSFIAPGIKLGLSNSVCLMLVYKADIKGAFAVNIARIMLSALLFGSPVSLAFSVCGGVMSLLAVSLVSRSKNVSEIGASILGGAVHNVFQCVAAVVFVGAGVLYYMPILLPIGAVCGGFTGMLVKLILKKVKTNGIF